MWFRPASCLAMMEGRLSGGLAVSMDDATLAALREALMLTPDNAKLRVTVAKALRERGEQSAALTLLKATPVRAMDIGVRMLGAELALAVGDSRAVLSFTEQVALEAAPDLGLFRVRALLKRGEDEAARTLYGTLVAAAPEVDDPALRQEVGMTVVPFPGTEKPAPDAPKAPRPPGAALPMVRPKRRESGFSFVHVGGLAEVKEQIRKRIIMPFQKPGLYHRFRRRIGGGVLLYGPPGVGKTLLAKATAGECRAAFFNVTITDVLDMWMGGSERNLSQVFADARAAAPSVLFFDELEALGGRRGTDGTHLVSQFLSEMDGFASGNEGVLILGATNTPWHLDPAFRRPGRFDRLMFIPPPDRRARQAILQIHLEGRPGADTVDLVEVATATAGFTGADLLHVVETAVDLAIEQSLARNKDINLSTTLLLLAAKQGRPSANEWLTTARNYARYANEAGQYDEVLAFLKAHTNP